MLAPRSPTNEDPKFQIKRDQNENPQINNNQRQRTTRCDRCDQQRPSPPTQRPHHHRPLMPTEQTTPNTAPGHAAQSDHVDPLSAIIRHPCSPQLWLHSCKRRNHRLPIIAISSWINPPTRLIIAIAIETQFKTGYCYLTSVPIRADPCPSAILQHEQ